MRMDRVLARAILAIVLTTLSIAIAPMTAAQLFVERTNEPLIERDAFDRFVETLDDDRSAIVERLFDDYAAHLTSTWIEYEQRAESFRGDAAGRHALDQERRRFAEARLAQFIDDVRAVLADREDALTGWNELAASQRRQRFLIMIYPAGGSFANVELSRVLEYLTLSDEEQEALEPALDAYHAKMDAIVEAYAATYIDQLDEAFHLHQAIERGEPRAIQRRRELGQEYTNRINAIAELNIETIPRISAALSDMNRQRWTMSVGEQTQPPLYRSSPTDHLVEFLRENESILPEADRREMELIYATYETERQRLRQLVTSESLRYAKSQKHEQLIKEDPSRQRAMRESPVPPYLRQLFELEKRTSAQLRALIGEARAKTLPLHIRWFLYWDQDAVLVEG